MVVEHLTGVPKKPLTYGADIRPVVLKPHMQVRFVQRLPLGIDYWAVVSYVSALMHAPELEGKTHLSSTQPASANRFVTC